MQELIVKVEELTKVMKEIKNNTLNPEGKGDNSNNQNNDKNANDATSTQEESLQKQSNISNILNSTGDSDTFVLSLHKANNEEVIKKYKELEHERNKYLSVPFSNIIYILAS